MSASGHPNRDMLITGYNDTPAVKIVVGIGKGIGSLLPARNASGVFCFFPFCHVGGAEKVHAAIVNCLADQSPWVFFTKKSANRAFLPSFGGRARIFDVWQLLKYGYPLSVGVMAGLINRHRNAVVFGSNSLFFYLLVRHLPADVRKIDLMHAFGGGSEEFSLPVADRLDARVAINSKTVTDFQEQYRRHRLPETLADRVVLIENCVDVPERYPGKRPAPLLKVLYVGRGSEEKRVHLVGRIASRCRQRGLPVAITIVGDAMAAVEAADRDHCEFLGEISDAGRLAGIYQDADLLLITSSREGFPMVIMEAMAHGVVPVSTDVGGIPVHVTNGKTGWLVENAGDEERIVEEMCGIIADLCKRREILEKMSQDAYQYARAHFGGEKFCSAYRSLLLRPRKQE